MKTAVCMKYVPVIARIKFDYEAKTIVRDGVPSEVNPFDLLGLVRAVELKDSPEDEVVVISMGPPAASEGLTNCMALGADRAVLLTDRALAGSDTLATSRALSLVLQRENPDLIICGRNSTDGETGQVGPEIAEIMGLPHVSHVRKLDLSVDGKSVVVERMTDEGYQTLWCDMPVVVCVTEGVAPELYPDKEQMERAEGMSVEDADMKEVDAFSFCDLASVKEVSCSLNRLVAPQRCVLLFDLDESFEGSGQRGLLESFTQTGEYTFGGVGLGPSWPLICVFGGENLSSLFVSCDDEVYAVSTRATGFQHPSPGEE